MEEDSNTFDLSQYLTDSLDLSNAVAPQTRHKYKIKRKEDALDYFYKMDPIADFLEENHFKPKDIVPEETLGTPIQEFFRGTNIFITGGTGFIGKVLIQKLIRSIPHIRKIHVLVRRKRGKSPKERFDQLLEDKVFMRMKVEVPHYASKIAMMEGDISLPDLGLSLTDRQLIKDTVHVVFHSAADVRFIEPLKAAIASNVLGSKRVLDLVKEIRNLKCFMHVSTAFSQCVRRVVPESIPKLSVNYKEILKTVETKTDEELEKNLPSIIQGWPNTYTFSKAVCEDMLQEEAENLPMCVFRPSAIVGTYKEPVRGWIDNMYGPIGLSVGAGTGVLHYYNFNPEFLVEVVPVDFVVNCMIAAVWSTASYRSASQLSLPVFNYTSTPIKATTWKLGFDAGEKTVDLWPYSEAIWALSFFCSENKVVDFISELFLHKIPGRMFDQLAVILGQKPRLSKIYDRLQTLKEPLSYFASRIWEFKTDNVTKLWSDLCEQDKEEFMFDIREVDYIKLLMYGKLGARYYLLKDPMDTIPAATRKQKWLNYAHNTVKFGCGLFFLKIMSMLAHYVPL